MNHYNYGSESHYACAPHRACITFIGNKRLGYRPDLLLGREHHKKGFSLAPDSSELFNENYTLSSLFATQKQFSVVFTPQNVRHICDCSTGYYKIEAYDYSEMKVNLDTLESIIKEMKQLNSNKVGYEFR